MESSDNQQKSIFLDLMINEQSDVSIGITDALSEAETELRLIDDRIPESRETLRKLTPECDKLDYALAASIGGISGLIDIFLVGRPGESPAGKVTDKWFENRVKDFAKLCGWKDKNGDKDSAIRYLEKVFKIPYDQHGAGDAAAWVFDLNPKNHHFKSLAHNPTLLGLFFSILDQFCNTSHFVTEGELICLEDADGSFELRGGNVVSKFFCAFVNWFGHLISDVSGSSGSKGRGMGIPSPLWSWVNDVIVILRKMNIDAGDTAKSLNDLAVRIFKEGYDIRFTATQAIPVVVNEILVRLVYSIRRMISYFSKTEKEKRSPRLLWEACEPFSNATVKRMLTVAHGTFCLLDLGDAVVWGFRSGGGTFNVVEFFLRLNIVGIGRFAISLYGEFSRSIERRKVREENVFLNRERTVAEYYVEGLRQLAEIYDDKDLMRFTESIKDSNLYKEAFGMSVRLAEKRGVPDDRILRDKESIDRYFERR